MFFPLHTYADNIAVVTEEGLTYTYAQLQSLTHEFSGAISNRGMMICMCRNALSSLVGYVGALNASVPTLLLDGHRDVEYINGYVSNFQPEYIWLPKEISDGFVSSGKIIYAFQDYCLIHFDKYCTNIHPDLFLLLTTSGSTGSPKLVRISKNNLLANTKSIIDYLHINSKERAITSLPFYYSYGMSVVNTHLYSGATILLTDKSVFQIEFVRFMKEYDATSFAGVPYTYEMLWKMRFLEMNTPTLKTLLQAGGKLKPGLAKQYIEKSKEKGKEFIIMYGQTEASPRMSYLPWQYAESKCGSIGVAIPNGEIEIVDENGEKILEPNHEGELVYKGPNVCMGYANNFSDFAKGDDFGGVLHTGDLAYVDNDGYAYITGRMKRFVKVWGNRCNLDALELLAKERCDQAVCIGKDDCIVILAPLDADEKDLVFYLSQKTGLNLSAFKVKKGIPIPRAESGKVKYSELNKLL